ncbi:alginate export family protein [Sphingomonas sp.]|uniref:alginate export family protein n=1 Tax=Sphingomonas sp. TaxID=28214 RepID=UPI002B992147|nr:alginate export family protein [Sphingomonas sp.]HTG37666.1 alginate export family protein [Sphingomonas sp.]
MLLSSCRRGLGAATVSLVLFTPAALGAHPAAPQQAGQQSLPPIPVLRTQVSPAESDQTRNRAAPGVTSYPAAAAGDGATSAGYNLSRWAEDWRGYRDPARRDDPLDRLKFLPLDDDGDIYLTLSGELRLRVNHTTNPNLREVEAQRQDINRIVAGADLHLGPNVRFFGEVAHGGIAGENIGAPAATLRNDAIVQQAFGEVSGDVAGMQVGARYGRQEFTDGSNLLVSQRDNNTIRYVLNGVRGWVRGARLRADLFDFELTEFGDQGFGDDPSDDDTRFSGATLGVVAPTEWLGGSKLYFDPFVWRLHDEQRWGDTTARERRWFTGARLWGDVGRATLDWTVNHQSGRFDNREIDAWQILAAQTYRLGAGASAPRIGFHADYATGGGGYDQGTLGNATTPFGNNIYYSYQLFLTPSNLITLAPNFTFAPVKGVRLTTEYQFAWRENATDAVYRANGLPFAGTELVEGSKIAESLRLQLVWSIAPRLSFTGRYEHLDAGPVLTRAGYAGSDFVAGWVSFRF